MSSSYIEGRSFMNEGPAYSLWLHGYKSVPLCEMGRGDNTPGTRGGRGENMGRGGFHLREYPSDL